MKKGKKETKDKKKTLSKNQKIVIAIVVISVFLIAACAVNIGLACKYSNVHANIFTAISGWIGFLATLGVGIVAYVQNKKYEERTYIERKLEKLIRARDVIYINSKTLNENGKVGKIGKLNKLKFDNEQRRLDFVEEVFNENKILQSQINDLYICKFNFSQISNVSKAIIELKTVGTKILWDSLNVDLYDDYIKKYDNIAEEYFKLLVEIDNIIIDLQNKEIPFKEFMEKMQALEDTSNNRNKILSFINDANKETQNGQAKDDVNGQDK